MEVEKGLRGAAGAQLDDRLRIDFGGRPVDRLEEVLQFLHRFFGARVPVLRVEAGGHAIQMLAIDLQSRVAPFAHESAHELERVVDGSLIGGAKIETIPPGNGLRRALFVQQQQIGVVVQQV